MISATAASWRPPRWFRSATFHNDEHTLKLGVNYRFNFASPVVARY